MTNVPSIPPIAGGSVAPAGPTVSSGSVAPAGEGILRTVTAVTTGTLVMDTYEIESLINSGGMGEVYRGRNIHNGEPVAIKIVLPSLAHDPKIVALFQRESSVLSRLSHDAIVRYHTFTIDRSIGRPCMVMEFVSGLPLADRIEQGAMPLDEVRVMFRRVASGLDKAHRAGVVHRDLSPDNIILEEGSVEHAKLIDFGIAKSMTGAGTLLGGQFAGKFNWVSPEQLGAFGGTVDGRSDIYSLALLIAAASKGAVLSMGASIVDAVGKRASVPDLGGVDPSLVPLLRYMLEPDPSERPATMAAVIAALDNPALIPVRAQAAAPGAPMPDPNRTIIGSPQPLPSLPPVGSRSQAAQSDIGTAAPGVDTGRIATEAPMSIDAEDVSPFGATAAPRVVSQTPPASKTRSSSGGLIAALAVLLVVGGGAAAWLTGAFDLGTAVMATGETKPVVTAEPAPDPKPAPEPKAAPEPAPTSEATPETAPALPPEPAAAEPVAGQETNPAPEPEPPVTTDPAPKPAPPEPVVPEPVVTDPKALQLAWLRDYKQPACLHVRLESDAGPALALEGFADAVAPLEKMAAAFQTATGVRPDVGVRLINDTQCAVLDFVNRHVAGSGKPVTMKLSDASEVVKSGSTVSGRIEGLAGRSVALFLVSGDGVATNLKSWVSQSSNGMLQFDFTVNLDAGSPPAPQMLLAIVTPDRLSKMDAVPNGVTVKSLMPFIDLEVTGAGQQVTTGLRFFRLEN